MGHRVRRGGDYRHAHILHMVNKLRILDLEKLDLEDDDWSLECGTRKVLGSLTVLGFYGRNKTGHKMYAVLCEVCSKDVELFGSGCFGASKNSLLMGNIPCGCSKSRVWSKDQYVVLCERFARKVGSKFVGFSGEWNAQLTTVVLHC